MPRLMDESAMETGVIGGMQGFEFSGVRTERLGATEYTLVTIAVDETGSVYGFSRELRDTLITAIEACKKSPMSDKILVRVIKFSSCYPKGIEEIIGFQKLAEIDSAQDIPELKPGGATPLVDACYSAIGAMNAYGQKLIDDDFGVNAICFIITDGEENASTATMQMVRDEAERAVTGEVVESMVSVLIGINSTYCKDELDLFYQEAGLTQYIDAGKVTKGKLAKLADFVSQSVSSQSQALGTGGPSQNISATI